MSAKKSPDFVLFALAVLLLVVGLVMVADASYARAGQAGFTGHDSFYFIKRQAVFAIIGLLMMWGAMALPYWKLKPWAIPVAVISVIGLVAVLIPGIGTSVNGAYRWIKVPGVPGLSFQPSEIAKLGIILYLAAALSWKGRETRDFKSGIIPALVPIGIMSALIMKEPDMGTTIVLVVSAFVMLYIAGARPLHLTGLTLVGLAAGTVLIVTSPYRLKRFLSFLDPFADYYGSGYQVCQSLIGLGSGGVIGTGICEGRQKLFFLPEPYTDFIFSVLGQEVGFIGTTLLAVLFLAFGLRGLTIAFRTRESFGKLLAGGISVMICFQALLNMAVVTSSLPATGVPLPFISYGGTSLALNLLCIGILLGISQYPAPVESYEHESRRNRRGYRRTRVSSRRRR